ncbi:hypothetical protein [Catalinimonas niigatensis]|uniref:hypothetical protein n=1 Tax=Catalinimonas niigatensis TaxID=1397264 RepID=UPI002666D3BB|nr:hypothetical protein [Catalinimonas niigatensis]WPP51182.1 hypothetical protein PZB72_02105 [Catalinimonas niigatensis]
MKLLNAFHSYRGIKLKNSVRLVFLISLILACSEEDDKYDDSSHLYTPKVKELEALTQKIVDKTWSVVSVTRSESDVTHEFSGFTIIFKGQVSYREVNVYGDYDAENGLDIFLAKGFWQFETGKESSQLVIDSHVVDYILSNNDTHIQLSLDYPNEEDTAESAKVKYIFELEYAL